MDREPVPSAIVTRLLEAAKELEQWAGEHRQANLTEHEQGVLQIFRRVMGPVLGAVLERALQLDHPAARRQRAACPGCGKHRRPHQWRTRQPVSVCGLTPFQRPYYWCPACAQGWAPADNVLGLDLHQILSAELQAWVAETGLSCLPTGGGTAGATSWDRAWGRNGCARIPSRSARRWLSCN